MRNFLEVDEPPIGHVGIAEPEKITDCGGDIEPTATREDDRLAPASIYAASKLAQEHLTRTACGALGIAHSILRFQNVFGEGQSLTNPYTGILSIFSTKIRLGQPLPVFEDGEELRDFVHVEDVAATLEQAVALGATVAVPVVDNGQIYFTNSARGVSRVAAAGGQVTVVSRPDSANTRCRSGTRTIISAIPHCWSRTWRWAATSPS